MLNIFLSVFLYIVLSDLCLLCSSFLWLPPALFLVLHNTVHNTAPPTIQPHQQYSPTNNTAHTTAQPTIQFTLHQQPQYSSYLTVHNTVTVLWPQYSYSLMATQCNHTMLSYFWVVGNAGHGRMAKTYQHIDKTLKKI